MSQINNPLHGITLETIVTELQKELGWQKLGELIQINCFNQDPSIKSSLKFLRKQQWARDQVEQLYLNMKQGKPLTANLKNKANPPRQKPKDDRAKTDKPKAAFSPSTPGANTHIWGKR